MGAGYRRAVHSDPRSADSSRATGRGSLRTAAPESGDGARDGDRDRDPRLDVVSIGNPLVDVLASAKDEDLVALDLVKGTMVLVDHERSESIYQSMGATTEASGGSAANTAAGVAALGGRAAFLG